MEPPAGGLGSNHGPLRWLVQLGLGPYLDGLVVDNCSFGLGGLTVSGLQLRCDAINNALLKNGSGFLLDHGLIGSVAVRPRSIKAVDVKLSDVSLRLAIRRGGDALKPEKGAARTERSATPASLPPEVSAPLPSHSKLVSSRVMSDTHSGDVDSAWEETAGEELELGRKSESDLVAGAEMPELGADGREYDGCGRRASAEGLPGGGGVGGLEDDLAALLAIAAAPPSSADGGASAASAEGCDLGVSRRRRLHRLEEPRGDREDSSTSDEDPFLEVGAPGDFLQTMPIRSSSRAIGMGRVCTSRGTPGGACTSAGRAAVPPSRPRFQAMLPNRVRPANGDVISPESSFLSSPRRGRLMCGIDTPVPEATHQRARSSSSERHYVPAERPVSLGCPRVRPQELEGL